MTGSRKFALTFAIMLGILSPAVGQTALEPLNKQVALAGKLREVHGYGPPGYGEDKKVDEPITYWVLDLPYPLNTACAPEEPQWAAEDCKAAKQLRLFFPTLPTNSGLELKAKAMKGQRVIASGVLHRADTMGEITPIYMDLAELKHLESVQ